MNRRSGSDLVKVRFPVVTDEMHEWLLANRQSLITSTFVICHWCDHDWHANRCHNCTCESSRSRPDDTWRPKLSYTTPDQARRIAHDTGLDGWSATACAGVTIKPGTPSPGRLKNLVYGKGVVG
jgi:hypothetical protein